MPLNPNHLINFWNYQKFPNCFGIVFGSVEFENKHLLIVLNLKASNFLFSVADGWECNCEQMSFGDDVLRSSLLSTVAVLVYLEGWSCTQN